MRRRLPLKLARRSARVRSRRSLKAVLACESALDTRTYEKGIKISDAEMKTLDIIGDLFHPNGTRHPTGSAPKQRS
jgi:hypothetical protein